ncbi:MAG: four helix bundle protein [Bacteroidia bacterium]|nr:four helix bundle protein [Bacteroidia bacterium]
MGNFKQLKVWQYSVEIAVDIYKLTSKKPLALDFGLCNQLQRCSVSIPSNIAEGDELNSDAQAIKYFYYSKGSTAELITQLIICEKVGFIDRAKATKLIERCNEISRMLNGIISFRSKK